MLYRFGDCEVDIARGEIRRGDHTERLQPRVLAVLLYLLERPEQIVSADELIEKIWAGRAIEPVGVARNIAQIRRALGDDSQDPSYIETIAKRGYRTMATVEHVAAPVAAESADGGEQPATSGELAGAGSQKQLMGWAAILLLLVVAIGGWIYTNQRKESSELKIAKSIAVLPFENLSPDPDNAYFAAGIHEETVSQLAKIKDFSVIARIVTDQFAYSDKSVAEIGRELNVSAVVSGSVRFAGNRVRVTAQLVDVGTGTQRWSEIYDRHLDDIFSIQSDIAESITTAMEVSFDLEARESIAAIPTENLEAYSAYLKGLAALNHVPSRVPEGVRELDVAIRLDPTFADALGLAALCRATMSLFQSPTPEDEAENLALARSLAQRALVLNPRQPSALSSLSYIALGEQRLDDQIAHARDAYELNPNALLTAYLYAEALSKNGKPDEAIPLFDRALALNPLNPNLAGNAAMGMALNGRWDQARRYAGVAIKTGRDAWIPYALAAWVEANVGNLDEATALLQAAEARFPPHRSLPVALNAGMGKLIATYTLTGQHEAADRELQKLISQRPVNHAALFGAYLDLGRLDEALEHAHLAVDEGFPAAFISSLAQTSNLPMYETLRGNPRFTELLEKVVADHNVK